MDLKNFKPNPNEETWVEALQCALRIDINLEQIDTLQFVIEHRQEQIDHLEEEIKKDVKLMSIYAQLLKGTGSDFEIV